MIYDRTISDVMAAGKIRTEKVQNLIELSDAEIQTLERGTITINTLNRIENKQAELQNLLNEMGYWNTSITNKTWQYTDIFNENEFKRIVDNTAVLKKAFFVYSNSPKDAIAQYHYSEINAIEKILFDLGKMVDYVKANYRECDTFVCGEG